MLRNQLDNLLMHWDRSPHGAERVANYPQIATLVNFFIPFAADQAQTERIRQRTIDNLTNASFEPLKNLVYQVTYVVDGVVVVQSVGQVSVVNNEIIMLIFRNDRGYLLCTYSRGVSWGAPIIAHYKDVESVVMFDEPQTE